MSSEKHNEVELSPEEYLAAVRDEWRRRYAGVALEGLLASGCIPFDDVPQRALALADKLLALIDRPAGS